MLNTSLKIIKCRWIISFIARVKFLPGLKTFSRPTAVAKYSTRTQNNIYRTKVTGKNFMQSITIIHLHYSRHTKLHVTATCKLRRAFITKFAQKKNLKFHCIFR